MDVTDELELGGRRLTITRPPDAAELIDEEAFARDEFLPYWAELWPSSVALARAVETLRPDGLAVVELGCGLALPAIVAALGGARVLATDWSPDALAYAERNARSNGAELETAHVAWSRPEPLVAGGPVGGVGGGGGHAKPRQPPPRLRGRPRVARGPFDVVLAADVLYEPRNAAQLLELLPRLGGETLLADPGRPALPGFLAAAESLWHVERTAAEELPRGGVYRLARRVT